MLQSPFRKTVLHDFIFTIKIAVITNFFCLKASKWLFYIIIFTNYNQAHIINIHRLSRWFFIFGLLALYYQQRASRAYDDLEVMRLLLATRKRAFLVLNFLHLWLCPSFIFFLIFLLSCLLFYPCFFFFFLLFSYSILFCSFFCSSAKPLLNPRTIRGFSLYKNRGRHICLPRSVLLQIIYLFFLFT